MPNKNIDNYYNRYDKSKNYDALLFRDGKPAQGSEHNELQSIMHQRIRAVANALFKDGDIISDAQIIVNAQTGEVKANAGAIYLDGAVRNIAAKTFIIRPSGTVAIGIRLIKKTISELEDSSLYNPAVGTKTHGMAGAWRLQVIATWGFEGDGLDGDFFPVHTVIDGIPNAKEAPPNLDAFNQSIAKYDRDSTGGGSYIVSGLIVRNAESNAENNAQGYTVTEGRARVHGFGITLPTSRRLSYAATPDLRQLETEVHIATDEETQRINVAHAPIHSITSLKVTLQKTVSMVHGAYLGVSDTLPDTAIVNIVECKQGDTIYATGDDYSKTGDTVNWSPSGAEPASGSTYDCTYTYMATLEPENLDFDGFTVSNAVTGSSIILGYKQALPRYDRLCLTQDGTFIWHKGIASSLNPRMPDTPNDVLPIATVYQTWREQSVVTNDGIRVTSFAEIESLNNRIDYVLQEVSRNRLESEITARENGARVGIFVDPLLNDEMRDQGIEQSASIIDGMLTLSIKPEIKALASPLNLPVTLSYTPNVVLAQTLRTGSMLVNPYMAFGILPASITLTPAIDRWTDVQTTWASAITQIFGRGNATSWSSQTQTLSSNTSAIEFLREIDINFSIAGFGGNEVLQNVVFDGLNVAFTPENLTADANGAMAGTFKIPPKVPAGAKTVTFSGLANGGSTGSAVFVGQGNLTVQTLRTVWTAVRYSVDPLAQTFMLDANTQICGVDLWFTAKEGEVRVQIREVQNGVPNRTILAEAIIQVDEIVVTGSGHTRIDFPILVQLLANTEYAIVVLCNDATTACAIATMGEFDGHVQKWVARQPYTVGVLLSSSNASTWTAHQDKDLTFRLLEASFTKNMQTYDMGNVDVTDATDLVMLALDESPASETQVEYELTMPDDTVLTLAASQSCQLANPITGKISCCAKLKGSAKNAPLLWPGAQLLTGTISLTDDYYTRSIPAINATKATLIYDAFIPSGATVTPEIQLDSGDWQAMIARATVNQGDGVVEYSFSLDLLNIDLIKVRITLAGTSSARPFVSNIRLMAIK